MYIPSGAVCYTWGLTQPTRQISGCVGWQNLEEKVRNQDLQYFDDHFSQH